MTGAQFDRTRQLALRLAGIELFERHREVLDRRSRRIGINREVELEALLDAAESGDPDARRRLVRLVTTKHTGFFRQRRHFEIAAETAVEAGRRNGAARLWCAGAATGEEAYSLAIATVKAFGREDPPVDLIATDIAEEDLSVGRLAV